MFVMFAIAELIEQAADVIFLAVLQNVIGSINQLVGIAKGSPIRRRERAVVARFAISIVHEQIGIQLPRCFRVVGPVMQIGRYNLVFAGPSALVRQM